MAQRFQDFAASKIAKWLTAGIAVVFATVFVVPFLKQLPFLSTLTAGMSAMVASLILVLVALFVGFTFKNQLGQFVAAGLGLASVISLTMTTLGPVLTQLRGSFRLNGAPMPTTA